MRLAKLRIYFYIILIFAMFTCTQTRADSLSGREYQLKAAFIYNFMMFIDWPKEKMPADGQPIIIGVMGENPFENAFEPIKSKQVKEKNIAVKYFAGLEDIKKSSPEKMNSEIEEIRKCHLLFICSSEKPVLQEIINLVNGYNILTVGDMDGFLESGGGVINFVVEDDKICFEINAIAALQSKLEIRSQLLRLAKKVIEEKQSQGYKKDVYEYNAKHDN
ncbi:MAG: hypothetical protein A2Y10_01760 [Planctomycetes bacterium GWF2_41_51]|nr:MAG: hypothetical protein A2Y10_01760 [Planctomycetes bacterium GWF2_41_51]HBG26335.1 hypothetical protein [Phycisphaerales bacterium]